MREEIISEQKRLSQYGETFHLPSNIRLYGENFEASPETVLINLKNEDYPLLDGGNECRICGVDYTIDEDIIAMSFYDEDWEYSEDFSFHPKCLLEVLKL